MADGAQKADSSEQGSIASLHVEQKEFSAGNSFATASLADVKGLSSSRQNSSTLPAEFGAANNLTISDSSASAIDSKSGGANGKANLELDIVNPGNSHPSKTPGGLMRFVHPIGMQVSDTLSSTIPTSTRSEAVSGGTPGAPRQGHQQAEQQSQHPDSSTRQWHRGERLRR